MKGVMKAMLLRKLRLVVGSVMVLVALGTVGFGYRAGVGSAAAQAAQPDKPRNELEALRRENELLKLNLEVVLEKVRAQEAELRTLRGQAAERKAVADAEYARRLSVEYRRRLADALIERANPVSEAEAALKSLREAKNKDEQRQATEALDKALQKLKQQTKPDSGPSKPQGN
jgi:hypothetical protein